MLRRCITLCAATALLIAPVAGSAMAATIQAPPGYDGVQTERLARGLEHLTLARSSPDASVHVAHIARKSDVELRAVSSFDRIAGGAPHLERTSSMCARVDCVVAINGDFFREGIPVGAVATDGELLRSPNTKHHQLMVSDKGRLSAGPMGWSGRIVSTDLHELNLDAVNRPRNANDLVLYTPTFARRTGTNPHGVEMTVKFVAPSSGRLMIGQTAVIRVVNYRHGVGNGPIPAGGAVLSAHGSAARALGALWKRIQDGSAGREALLRVETTPDVDTVIGGTPVVLRDGAAWFGGRDDSFVRTRHPRTLVGWNRKGDVWLVTVDGRQAGHSAGFSLAEAATFMRSLGATDAINLDGGGSTTFVVRGQVVNRPSDRAVNSGTSTVITRTVARGVHAFNVERPVTNALVVVPKGARELPPAGPPDLAGTVPQVKTLAAAAQVNASDPASDPAASLPAVVGLSVPELPEGRGAPFALAGLLNVMVAAAVVRAAARRRHLSGSR